MALNIGTLVGYLSLDDTNFNRKADAADRKINALKLHLDALKATNPKISVEVDAETAKLDLLEAKIKELRAESAKGVDVKVEMTQAMIELDRVQTKLRDLHNKEVKVKVDVDDAAATAKVDALDAKLSALQSKIRGSGGPGWMPTLIAGLGPALLPTLTAATGGMIALGSGAVAAAGGIGVLKLAYHGLSAEVQAYTKYQTAMANATTKAQRQSAQHTLATSAYGTASAPAQDMTRFVVNQGMPAFHQLQNTAQRAVFPGTTSALRELVSLLPVADRLVSRLGDSMGTMEQSAAQALGSPFWVHWFNWLGKEAKTDLPLIGTIFGDTFEGIARIIQRFAPQGQSLLMWLMSLSSEFDRWTMGHKGSSFSAFMRQVPKDAKAVMGVLSPLAKILKGLGSGLSAGGYGELRVIGDGLSLIAKIPPGPFRVLGEAIGPFFLALKGIGLARGAASGLVGIAATLSKFKGFGGLGKFSLGKFGGTVAGEVGSVAIPKGVVPVYVTNMGAGGLPGPGGKDIPIGGAGGKFGVPLLTTLGTVGAIGGLVGGGFAAEVALINHLQRFKPSTLNVPYAPNLAAPSGATQHEMGAAAIRGAQMGVGTETLKKYNEQLTRLIALDRKLYPAANSAQAGIDMLGKGFQQLIKVNPSGAMSSLQDISDKTGISIKHLVQLVPGLGAAMKDAGIPTTKLGVALAQLPKKVQTAVETPGAIQSMADVRKLARQYDLTPKQIRTLIQVLGGNQAIAVAQAVQQKLDALHSKDVTIRVNEIHAVAFGPHAKATKQATGGHITGPGTGTSDSIPARLSNGEYVIRAAAVKRYGVGLFDALNAERFASGGRVHRRHHHLTSKQHAALLRQLAAAQKVLGRTDTTIGNALSFGQAFAGNVFGAGLPTTKDITVPGKTFTEVINGQTVTESTPATTKTVKLSQAQILAEMMRYQKGQLAQARQVERDVKRLRREGVSRSLLAQMQAGGAQGIAEIHALAQGSRAQVHQFNRLNAATTSALNNAGAHAIANSAMATLQRQKANEEATVRAIRKAIRDGVPVVVKHSSKLRKV